MPPCGKFGGVIALKGKFAQIVVNEPLVLPLKPAISAPFAGDAYAKSKSSLPF